MTQALWNFFVIAAGAWLVIYLVMWLADLVDEWTT